MNPGYLYDHPNHPGNNPANNPPPPLSASSLHYMYNPVEMVARHITPFQQGLSLSSSSQQSRYRSQADDGRAAVTGDGVVSGVLLNSKYVKVTQEILEEVVNVGKLGVNNSDQSTKKLKKEGESLPVNGEDKTIKSGDLSTGERQEINMKKAKLVNMLDEVEQRYRQYHQQMQIVISWFEQAAGMGSANSYTSLALQTISKQFRCLKDEITEQIKTARRSLGEEDGSQMKFVDNHFRLQQLGMGMIQHNNAWRPQRGLPERSVSVLRAWLFQHFLHPYPKDLDKTMLAKQTGLTRSQVSNWFINARVRLWKPMVEEMYLEEVKVQERNGKEDEKSTKIDENEKQEKIESPENLNFRPTKQENTFHSTQFQNPSGFSLMGSLEMDEITQFSPKKPKNNDVGFTITAGNSTDFMTRLGSYSIGDQFQQPYSGNGVSLTLGLPHCENVSISSSHQSFLHNQIIELQRGAEFGEEDDYTAMNPPSSSAVYESMNIQNRKRFAAQPLPKDDDLMTVY